MKKRFYITTPIYYTNGVPHIWHAYSSLVSDVIAKYKRNRGYDVKFSTWVDENSQKALLKANELWMDIMDYLDSMSVKHKAVWDWLNISYTDYIRTTEKRHADFVQSVIKKTYEAWFIRKWAYEWLYCVWCEAFKKPEELNEDGLCPDHLTKPELVNEENYFFELSRFQKKLEEFYEANPNFTIPNNRFNEMKTFLKEWLEDFSISRNKKLFWIPFPIDNDQVTYVWYDALFNYLTVCQGWDEEFWPADLHVVGKEIARFHVIYWPAMLEAAWYEKPKNVLVTWFITVDGQKISKSLWNVIDPVEFSNKYSRDLMLLYLLTAFSIWQDWDFSEELAVTIYNAKLANNLWNLLNRVIVLGLKIWWKISSKYSELTIDSDPLTEKDSIVSSILETFDRYDLKNVFDKTFEFCDILNNYTTKTEPWKLISDWNTDEAEKILYTLAEWLRNIAIILHPFFTDKMNELFVRLGLNDYPDRISNWEIDILLKEHPDFEIKEKWEPLYPRFEKSEN